MHEPTCLRNGAIEQYGRDKHGRQTVRKVCKCGWRTRYARVSRVPIIVSMTPFACPKCGEVIGDGSALY